jgi:hypothetical protein
MGLKARPARGGIRIDDKPLPARASNNPAGRAPLYPFHELSVGQSFFVSNPDKWPDAADAVRALRSTADHHTQRTGAKFAVRPEGRGARVYRTA